MSIIPFHKKVKSNTQHKLIDLQYRTNESINQYTKDLHYTWPVCFQTCRQQLLWESFLPRDENIRHKRDSQYYCGTITVKKKKNLEHTAENPLIIWILNISSECSCYQLFALELASFLSLTRCKIHTNLLEIFTFKIGQVPVLLGTAP